MAIDPVPHQKRNRLIRISSMPRDNRAAQAMSPELEHIPPPLGYGTTNG